MSTNYSSKVTDVTDNSVSTISCSAVMRFIVGSGRDIILDNSSKQHEVTLYGVLLSNSSYVLSEIKLVSQWNSKASVVDFNSVESMTVQLVQSTPLLMPIHHTHTVKMEFAQDSKLLYIYQSFRILLYHMSQSHNLIFNADVRDINGDLREPLFIYPYRKNTVAFSYINSFDVTESRIAFVQLVDEDLKETGLVKDINRCIPQALIHFVNFLRNGSLMNSVNMIALSPQGNLHILDAAIQSDFAGPMFPVGYKLVHKLVTYIEREDELDIVQPCVVSDLEPSVSPVEYDSGMHIEAF